MAVYITYGEGEADAVNEGGEWLKTIIASQKGAEAGAEFDEKFKELSADLENNQCYGPVFDLFLEHSEDLFGAIPEARGEDRVKEVESFFALALSMLLMSEEAEHMDSATTRLCKLLTSSTQQHPDLRLRLLMNLHNTFPPSLEFRYRVFKYIIDYAAEANLFDQVMPYLEYLDAWMADWETYKHLSPEDKRTLFLDLSRYVRAIGKRLDSFQLLKRYHQLFQVDGADLKDHDEDATAQLLIDAIQIPSVIQFDDILSYDTVKALAKTKRGDLVKLCDVFFTGTVNDLRDFHKKKEALFKEHGLEIQDAMSKIKLLTMATMAQGRSEMSLQEVAKGIEESEDSIEPWVVRAISEGVIDGRIDQLNHKVLVKSAFQRKFEKDEWAFLDTKLSSWIDNLESVIKFIGEQKTLKEASGAAALATAAGVA